MRGVYHTWYCVFISKERNERLFSRKFMVTGFSKQSLLPLARAILFFRFFGLICRDLVRSLFLWFIFHVRETNQSVLALNLAPFTEKFESFPVVVFELRNQLRSIPNFLLEFSDKSAEQFQGKPLRHFHRFLLNGIWVWVSHELITWGFTKVQSMLSCKFAGFLCWNISLNIILNLSYCIKAFLTWSSRSALLPIRKITVFGDAWLVASVNHASKWLKVCRRVISYTIIAPLLPR